MGEIAIFFQKCVSHNLGLNSSFYFKYCQIRLIFSQLTCTSVTVETSTILSVSFFWFTVTLISHLFLSTFHYSVLPPQNKGLFKGSFGCFKSALATVILIAYKAINTFFYHIKNIILFPNISYFTCKIFSKYLRDQFHYIQNVNSQSILFLR